MIVSTIPGHSYFINSPVDGTVSTADGSVQLLAFKAGVQIDFSAPADTVRVLPDDSRIIVRENFKSAPARAAAAPAGADVTPEQKAAWDASARRWSAPVVEIGQAADAGSASVAVGLCALSPCSDSVAVGAQSFAGASSVAVGYCAHALNEDSVAVGSGTEITGQRSVLVGRFASAETDSVSIGYRARSTSGNIAIGADSQACAVDTTVLGTCAYAIAPRSTVVGAEAKTNLSENVVIGARAAASNTESVVVGYNAVSKSGYGSVAVGAHARATVGHSVVVGNSSSLEGYCTPATLVGPNLSPPSHVYSVVAVLGAGSTCTTYGQLAIFFYRKAGDVFMGFQTKDGSNAPVYKEVSMTRLFNLVQ